MRCQWQILIVTYLITGCRREYSIAREKDSHGREGAIAPHDIIIGSFVHGSGCEDMSGFLLRHVYRIVPEPRIEGEMGGSLCWKTIGIGVKFVGRESR